MLGDVAFGDCFDCSVVAAIGSHFPMGVGLGIVVVDRLVWVMLPIAVGLGIVVVDCLVGVLLRVSVVVGLGVIVSVPLAAALDLKPIESHA